MKKLLIVVVGVLTMTACGNKTKGGEAIDSTLVDSLMTDSVVLGVSDLWTVDAVEAQIRLCFEEVNRMAEADGIYINRLDSMFCSKDFLELQDQLYAKVRESQVMFDGDEGHHWTAEIGSEMNLYLEDGAWKIHDWIDTDVYPFGSLFTWMQHVIDGNDNDGEEKESNLNNYAE